MADKYISKLNIGGTTYDIKDTVARQATTGGIHYKGTTTTKLEDGSHTVPSDIYTGGATPAAGDLVIYGNLEFIATVNGSEVTWHEFGSTGSLKALAFKDNASEVSGHVHTATYTDTDSSKKLAATITNGTITVDAHSYTPEGTISIGSTLVDVLGTSTVTKQHLALDTFTPKTYTAATTTLSKNPAITSLTIGSAVVTPVNAIGTITPTYKTLATTAITEITRWCGDNLVRNQFGGTNGVFTETTIKPQKLVTNSANTETGKIITGNDTPVYATVNENDETLTLSAVGVVEHSFNYGISNYGASLEEDTSVTGVNVIQGKTNWDTQYYADGSASTGGTGANVVRYIQTNNVDVATGLTTTGATGANGVVSAVTTIGTNVIASKGFDEKLITYVNNSSDQFVTGLASGTTVATGITSADGTKFTYATGGLTTTSTSGASVVSDVTFTGEKVVKNVSATFEGKAATLSHTVGQTATVGTVTLPTIEIGTTIVTVQ